MTPGRSNGSVTPTARVGRLGERAAERELRRNGYRCLARNARLAGGEIDLVMLAPDRRTVVVVEVKAKLAPIDHDRAPPPEASVTRTKRRQLIKLTRALIAAEGWHDRPVRIDVVGVVLERSGDPSRSGWLARLRDTLMIGPSRGFGPGRLVRAIHHFPGAIEGSALGAPPTPGYARGTRLT
jgi:Holliday junction resolvase-like predicted endonuclease